MFPGRDFTDPLGMASIYGTLGATPPPIYGEIPSNSADQIKVAWANALESLYRTTTIIEGNVQTLFPPTFVLNEIVGSMSVRAYLPPVLYVRVTWRQRYPDKLFDTKNILQRLQIKGIYLEYGMDHRADPLFKDSLGLTLA